MRNLIILLALILGMAACGEKEPQGKLVYTLNYELPDSLKSYIYFMPKEAVVYYKGDSTATVHHKAGDESITVITHQKTGFMQALLKSPEKKYAVPYTAADQKQDRSMMPSFTFKKEAETKQIAGIQATKYTLTDKMTGQTSEAWFSTAVAVPPSYLSQIFDPAMGVPLIFSTNQNGIITHTAIKEIKTGEKNDGMFGTPAGYEKISYQELLTPPSQ